MSLATPTTKATAYSIPIWTRISSHALQESDIDDLVAFLASLTSPDYNTPVVRAWARQHALAHTNRPHRDPTRACGPNPGKPRLLDP